MIPQRLEAMSKCLDELRDKLITKARNGEITPQEAEAEAKAAGLPPFATQPEFAAFDPMAESRWPIVKAIAWITWRDLQLVMEQGAAFRSLCSSWAFHEWSEPTENGEQLAKHAGWFLEPWPPSNAVFLSFLDSDLRSSGRLPASARLTPREAAGELWRALSEGRLKAEGFDKGGSLVEIRAGEWAHLKLFAEHNQDVVKYDPLDRDEPFTKVRLRRDDLLAIWPGEGATSKSEGDCRRWLIALMRESPERRPKQKSEYQKEAQQKFGNLALRQFQRAWEAAIAESAATGWSKAGRPKTKSNQYTK
jgi:hypothetical protein